MRRSASSTCSLLDLELALVRKYLPRHARMVGERGDALGTRLEYLDRYPFGVVALGPRDADAHAVAGDTAVDEDDVAVLAARDAVAAVREGVDGQLQLGTPLGALGACGRRAHRATSIAGFAISATLPGGGAVGRR